MATTKKVRSGGFGYVIHGRRYFVRIFKLGGQKFADVLERSTAKSVQFKTHGVDALEYDLEEAHGNIAEIDRILEKASIR